MSWQAADAVARAATTCARLGLHVRRGIGGRLGERRLPGRPQDSGIEIETLRPYAPGDDVRHLDWNAVGRLDALVTRRFTAERQVRFDLLIDASASMGLPERDRKLDAARELAMALAWMGLVAGDTVRLVTLGSNRAPLILRHRANAPRAAAWLAALAPRGTLDLGAGLATHARRHPGPAVAVVVSDLMAEPATLEPGVMALAGAQHLVVLLHLLGRDEIEPPPGLAHGVLRDVESGATHPIALDPALRACYRALLESHLRALAGLAARARGVYVHFASDEPVPELLAGRLARAGLVRRR
jgi:uncharacterized protein (DUF58 family)